MYKFIFKRVIDLLISGLALIVLSPIFITLFILLTIANQGAGVFFLQERPGIRGRIFRVIKFKTMSDKRDARGTLLPDNERITRIGKLVRASSLDELPQLINVIKGDMALIGPRPLLVKYLPLYNSFQNRRHEVKPGITGWAQVNGRNAISWDDKFALDIYYVDNVNFWLDVKIIFLTIRKVFTGSDINSSTDAPMETFRGNERDSI